jgi:tannase
MRLGKSLLTGTAYVAAVKATTLADTCTVTHVQASLPINGTLSGLEFDSTSVTAGPVYSASTRAQEFFPDATYDYCNVTLCYSHDG